MMNWVQPVAAMAAASCVLRSFLGAMHLGDHTCCSGSGRPLGSFLLPFFNSCALDGKQGPGIS